METCRHNQPSGQCPKCRKHAAAMEALAGVRVVSVVEERDALRTAVHELRGEAMRLAGEVQVLREENERLRRPVVGRLWAWVRRQTKEV